MTEIIGGKLEQKIARLEVYTKEQLEKTWDDFMEAQKLTAENLRASCPRAWDTQTHLGNVVTFIGTDLMIDSLPKMREVFFGLLEKPAVMAVAKNDRELSALERLGIKQ